ncbi:MAG TPA: hypothetical protein P5107_10785 [Thermotogota bacterium]|nr:hypothetical protein [Thermotogota bacterium]
MNKLEKIFDKLESSDLALLMNSKNNTDQLIHKTPFYHGLTELFEEVQIIRETFIYRKKMNLLILGDFTNNVGYQNINALFGNRFSTDFFIQLQKIQFFQINNAREDGSMKLFLHKEFRCKADNFSKIKRLLAEYGIQNISEISEGQYRIDDRTFLKIDTNDKIATDLFSGAFPSALKKLIEMKMIEKISLDLNLRDSDDLAWNQILWISYIDHSDENDNIDNIKRAINSCFFENYHIFIIGEKGETFVELIRVLLDHSLNNLHVEGDWKEVLWYYKITFDVNFELKKDPHYDSLMGLFDDRSPSENKVKPKAAFLFENDYQEFLPYLQKRFDDDRYVNKLIDYYLERIAALPSDMTVEIAGDSGKHKDKQINAFSKNIFDVFYYLKDLFTSYPEEYIKEYLEKINDIIGFGESDSNKIDRYTEAFMQELRPELLYKIHRKLLNIVSEYIQEQINDLQDHCEIEQKTADLSYFIETMKQMAVLKLKDLKKA